MLQQIAGKSPCYLAQLAKGMMRAKIPDLSMALEGGSGTTRGSDRIRRNQDTLCCSRWSAVCGEQVEGLGAVVFSGAGVGADGVEAGVAEQVGDDKGLEQQRNGQWR